jgi:hypothetical protein
MADSDLRTQASQVDGDPAAGNPQLMTKADASHRPPLRHQQESEAREGDDGNRNALIRNNPERSNDRKIANRLKIVGKSECYVLCDQRRTHERIQHSA